MASSTASATSNPPYLPLCSDHRELHVEAGLIIQLGHLLVRRRKVLVPECYVPVSNENPAVLEKAIQQAEDRIAEGYSTRKDQAKSRVISRLCVYQNEKSRIEPRLLRIVAVLAAELVLENNGWMSVYEVAKAAALNPLDPAELLELRRVVAVMVAQFALEIQDTDPSPPRVSLSKTSLDLLLGGKQCIADMGLPNIVGLRQWRERKAAGQQPKPADPAGQAASPQPFTANTASPKALYEHLRSIVIGQDDACRVLAVRGYLHLKRMQLLQSGKNAGRNECLFFAGPSGTGKTYLSENFGKCSGLPFCSFTSTDATTIGIVGLDICEDSLKSLIRSTGEAQVKDAADKARYGVLLFDEWTKKAVRTIDITGRDISGTSVQQEVLRMMEGSKVILGARRADRDGLNLEFNATGLMTVFAGHMAGFDQVVKRLKRRKSGLGFTAFHGDIGRESYLTDALIDYGFIPEWVNRLSGVAFFNQLKREDLMAIARLPDGPIAGYNALLQPQGLQIQISEAGIGEMADLCIETGLMARGLRLITGALIEEAIFDGRKGVVVFGQDEVRQAISRVSALDDKAVNG